MKPAATLWTILILGLLTVIYTQQIQAAPATAGMMVLPSQQSTPSTPTALPPSVSGNRANATPFTAAQANGTCPNLVANGDFEQEIDWSIYPEENGTYDKRYANSGVQSLSLKTFDGRSTSFWQTLTIPANASQLTLEFDSLIVTGTADQNVMVTIYDAYFVPLQTLPLTYSCDCDWLHFTPMLNRAKLAGHTIKLEFSVAANGAIDEVNFDNIALKVCQSGPTATPLPLPFLLAPQGEITTDTPSFSWRAMPGAVNYLLWVNEYSEPNNNGKIDQEFSPAEANCASGTTCTVNPGVRFHPNGGRWWITAYFDSGAIASESIGSTFTINPNGTPSLTATPTTSATLPPSPTATQLPPTTATPTVTATETASATPPTISATPTATAPVTPTSTGVGDGYENDDSCAQARTIPADSSNQRHSFHRPADIDWVRFTADAQTQYRIEVTIPDGSAADVVLELHLDCANAPTVLWNKTFAPGVQLDFEAKTSGPIFLRFSNQDSNTGDEGVTYDLSVRSLSAEPKGGAVIIVAGRLRDNDLLQRNIHYVTDRVYQIFQAQGYTNDDIYYLATDAGLTGHDAAATKEKLAFAITEWAATKVGPHQALTLYLMDHGGIDKFYLDGANQLIVTPAELNAWLTAFETSVPTANVNIILEACYIGSFISLPDSISSTNRVIIASSDDSWSAYASRDGAYFSDHFLTALQQGRNLFSSFAEAKQDVNHYFAYQNPWLDANGNGMPNEQEDFIIAADRGFAYAGTLLDDSWPPYIVGATAPITIAKQHGQISVEVRDDNAVDSVWAVVYAPSYVAPNNEQELTRETAPTMLLTAQGNDRYEVEYPAFDEVGTYRILIHAKDRLGNLARPVEMTVEVGSRIYLPLVAR